ncbi:hypothetical protein ANCDUO_02932 [Ancylostoma duodenale]|uniref:Uncharacterized protein n=1 Tax=Ancylostoma duodenale TaxID=51022 RepID=A0A0C2DV59_9BILA|nr:hypothetical protein ANCDUO_02932 [Ancylostoma duodenale]
MKEKVADAQEESGDDPGDGDREGWGGGVSAQYWEARYRKGLPMGEGVPAFINEENVMRGVYR